MWLSKYFVYFVIFSCMGWIYESIYCTVKGGKWQNRGFLYGPVCPIYGTGGVLLTIIIDNLEGNFSYTWWQVFIVSFFGSIVLEYVTSWTLEKLFHAYWWDYSKMPLNIHGRVCFPCSVGFGCAGLIVVYCIAPFTRNMTGWMTPILYELFGLIFMGVIMVDTTLTVSALTNFARNVANFEDNFNARMDLVVDTAIEKKNQAAELITEEKEKLSIDNVKQLMLENKEKLSHEGMRGMLDNMGGIKRSALNRVQGFRFPEVDKNKAEIAIAELKNFVSAKKKEFIEKEENK